MSDKKDDSTYFFGGIDRKIGPEGELNPSGKILSEYPAWYHSSLIEDLKEEIGKAERNIQKYKRDRIFDDESIYRQNRDLDLKKKKLEVIENSRPKLSGKQKDDFYKEYNRLGNEIRNYLFTKSEMTMGTASPHEEAERMTNPCDITVSPEVARSLNLQVTADGKVSRSQAEKGWKVLGGYFGEPTNVEALRRDRTTIRSRH